jgi:hypothetical protein
MHGLGGELASLQDGFMDGFVVEHGGDCVDGLAELLLDEVFDDELQNDWLANSRLSPEGRLVHPILGGRGDIRS